MLVSGALVVHAWLRARRGESGIWFASDALGVFYAIAGVGCVFYAGRPFFWLFFVLGVLLLACGAMLRSRVASATGWRIRGAGAQWLAASMRP